MAKKVNRKLKKKAFEACAKTEIPNLRITKSDKMIDWYHFEKETTRGWHIIEGEAKHWEEE